jgi:predicted dehydrogenase
MYVQARSLIASGALGEIRTVFTSFNEPIRQDSMPAWKRSRPTGGGVLLDLGSHHTDLLRWFLNSEAAQVALPNGATTDDHYLRTGLTERPSKNFSKPESRARA